MPSSTKVGNRKCSTLKKAPFLVLVLAASLSVACGNNPCSGSDRSRKVECGGTMSNGAYWGTTYDPAGDIFYGGIWCHGMPESMNDPPTRSCASVRGAAKRGLTVVCLGYPAPGSTEIPQIVISCG